MKLKNTWDRPIRIYLPVKDHGPYVEETFFTILPGDEFDFGLVGLEPVPEENDPKILGDTAKWGEPWPSLKVVK